MSQAMTSTPVDEAELAAHLAEKATELHVPGAAAGIYIDGNEHYAVFGVTSIENPLPVDEDTLFQFGSTGKTYTATAIMRLVEAGRGSEARYRSAAAQSLRGLAGRLLRGHRTWG
jgi:CubicO group peptidase (beta-lactamase class C family)